MSALKHLAAPQARRMTAAHHGGFKFLSIARTHQGCVRALNEDAFLDRPEAGLWAVADGMGGHDCGEIASACVVDALADVDMFGSAYAFRDAVFASLQRANAVLVQKASERLSGPIGATVVSLLAYQGHYACIWAGDSRAYLYRGGELRRLTRDHSVIQALVDAGKIGHDEARAHARANQITRAVGAECHLELDSVHGKIQRGDRFLLCSDGLTSMVDEREIADIIRRPPLQAAVDKLIARALARGANDNVTALLIGAEGAEGGADALG